MNPQFWMTFVCLQLHLVVFVFVIILDILTILISVMMMCVESCQLLLNIGSQSPRKSDGEGSHHESLFHQVFFHQLNLYIF